MHGQKNIKKYLHVSRTEKLVVPTVHSNGSGYTEHALVEATQLT